jgi:hypothetical protein
MLQTILGFFSGSRRSSQGPTTPEAAYAVASLSPTTSNMDALFKSLAPRDLGLEIVEPGDPDHLHEWMGCEWDEKYGKSFNPDPDPGTPIAFVFATWRDLYRCSCGAKGIKSERALI